MLKLTVIYVHHYVSKCQFQYELISLTRVLYLLGENSQKNKNYM